MARTPKHSPGQYRKVAFAHWLNLSFLALGGLAGALIDPALWLVMVPLELGALWVLPDIPMFRVAVDAKLDAEKQMREREYFMQQLWGLTPAAPKTLGQRLKNLFTEAPEVPLEARVVDRKSESFRTYMELRQIIAKLHELRDVRGAAAIPQQDIDRFEQVINGYLRFKMAQRALAVARNGIDARKLGAEIADIDAKLENATPQLRNVLMERRRLCQVQLDRLPKLDATLELFKTRADSLVQQMRNIHGQALVDPGMNVHEFLENVIDRQELLSDPLGEIGGDDALIRELLGGSAPVKRGATAQKQG